MFNTYLLSTASAFSKLSVLFKNSIFDVKMLMEQQIVDHSKWLLRGKGFLDKVFYYLT